MLLLHRACVRRGADLVLRHVSLRCERPGLLFLVGAGGAGKSSLLAALAGNRAREALSISGTVELAGQPIDTAGERIAWVPQRLRGTLRVPSEIAGNPARNDDTSSSHRDASAGDAERLAAIHAGLQQDATLHLLDEPTAGLAPAQIDDVRRALAARARDALVIVATHNRQDCLALGGRTALLAGGRMQECAPSAHFFSSPATPAGRIYVETGNCSLPDTRSPTPRKNGTWWVIPGLMCGMSRPGLMAHVEQQYDYLHRHGVRRLFCLEERCEYALAPLLAAGIGHHHFCVPDMAPPAFAQSVDLCRLAEASIRHNEGVAVHCRGGLGRTGTGLASILVWLGDSASAAIARIRRAEPLAIQSNAQIRFIHDFAERIRGWHPTTT